MNWGNHDSQDSFKPIAAPADPQQQSMFNAALGEAVRLRNDLRDVLESISRYIGKIKDFPPSAENANGAPEKTLPITIFDQVTAGNQELNELVNIALRINNHLSDFV